MARRPNAVGTTRAAAKQIRTKAAMPHTVARPSRIDRLVEVIDHCTSAKDAADEIGEKFLSYLLSMAIQESRSAMRPSQNLLGRQSAIVAGPEGTGGAGTS